MSSVGEPGRSGRHRDSRVSGMGRPRPDKGDTGTSPTSGEAIRRGARLRTPRQQALDESMPYLVVGIAILGVGIYAVVGQLALYAGRLPLWVLLASVGSIMIMGGTLSSLTYDDFEGIAVDPRDLPADKVLVDREEWLSMKRSREAPETTRGPVDMTSFSTWTPAQPSPGLVVKHPEPRFEHPSPAFPAPVELPARPEPETSTPPPNARTAVETPRRPLPNEAYDSILRLTESIERDLTKEGRPASGPGGDISRGVSTPAPRPTRPDLVDGEGTASSQVGKARSMGVNAGNPPAERPNPPRARLPPNNMPPKIGEGLPREPMPWVEGHAATPVTGSAPAPTSLKPRLQGLNLNPCAGCGKAVSSDESPVLCDSCELPICSECLNRERRAEGAKLCPTCAMLLGAADTSP